jgi:hypothetical protein
MMKMVEVPNEGLPSLIGKRVLLMCANYFYTGTLVGVNKSCVRLDDAAIVYETGDWSAIAWKDAQKLPKPIYVRLQFVESYCEAAK